MGLTQGGGVLIRESLIEKSRLAVISAKGPVEECGIAVAEIQCDSRNSLNLLNFSCRKDYQLIRIHR